MPYTHPDSPQIPTRSRYAFARVMSHENDTHPFSLTAVLTIEERIALLSGPERPYLAAGNSLIQSIGKAKLMFWAVPCPAVVMPINNPSLVKSAPPLEPGEIGALV